ncbi:CMD domain protein [Reyranella sp. CPCC 100927]|uniref:CMD domain protein n=1 Tax=Reyranella sp. CPCC 100927 TaxID=2599616 RepID=UPI0011B3D5CE|nr:CMD domain protein [Reyranella sp. CPCC 100927]TWT10611.1 CMD domain protein [Reyranella sp. CPCC 100927]
MSAAESDVIDTLVGIKPGTTLDAIRARRPDARTHAQVSFRALFTPQDLGDVSAVERFAVARFIAGLHDAAEITAFYADGLAASGASDAVRTAIDAALAESRATGPYGRYPAGPLSAEDTAGPAYRASAETTHGLGRRLAAAFEHTHMLVFHPRDAAAPALQALLDAGWSTTGIVTLSQLVAFLSFQIRVVAGLRTLSRAA